MTALAFENSNVTDNPSSIAKAARVLRALAAEAGEDAGVTDIAARSELPKSTTHRVLAELITEGFVGRAGQRYCLGPRWFEFQSHLSSSEWVRLTEQAKRPLAALFERTNATIHLGVLDGEQVLYLEKLTAHGGTSVPTRVGAHMPATHTALGKCLLAFAGNDVMRTVLSKPLHVASRSSIAMPRILLRQLEEIRRTGLSYDLEETQAGVVCVSAPVVRDGRVVAAVSLTRVRALPVTSADAREVTQAARQVSEWLTHAAPEHRVHRIMTPVVPKANSH